jgi:hypothetical protein
MVRPTIDDEVVERLTDAVDARTKVPAEHLGIGDRLAFVLDELEEADARAARLEDRVSTLEAELEAERQQPDDTGLDDVTNTGTGNLGGFNPNDRL